MNATLAERNCQQEVQEQLQGVGPTLNLLEVRAGSHGGRQAFDQEVALNGRSGVRLDARWRV
jgi:hypothetical protein